MFESDSSCILGSQPLFNTQKIVEPPSTATQGLFVFVNINILIFILTHDMYTFPVKF